MKAKKALVIILTVLIFLSCCTLGFAAVFRIESVQVNPTTVSNDAKQEAQELQALLTEAYKSENTAFAKADKAKEIVNAFPYFRFIAFKKAYPNRVVVEVSEDAEVYAVAKDGEAQAYYILNAQGTILGIRDNYINRADTTGQEYNVLLQGFLPTGDKGETLMGSGNYAGLFTVCQKADEVLGGIRGNVISANIIGGFSAETVVIQLITREGVKLYLRNPFKNGEAQTEALIRFYLSEDGQGLTDQQRTHGAVLVYETAEGMKCTYSDQDLPTE